MKSNVRLGGVLVACLPSVVAACVALGYVTLIVAMLLASEIVFAAFGLGIVTTAFALEVVQLFAKERFYVEACDAKVVHDRQNEPWLWDALYSHASMPPAIRPRIYIFPDTRIRAFAMGIPFPRCSAIFVSTGCVDTLPHDALTGVVMHEFAHIILAHSLTGSVLRGANVLTAFQCTDLVYLAMRHQEFAADAVASYLIGSVRPMIQVLAMLYEREQYAAQARFSGGVAVGPLFDKPMSTHPTHASRMNALRELAWSR